LGGNPFDATGAIYLPIGLTSNTLRAAGRGKKTPILEVNVDITGARKEGSNERRGSGGAGKNGARVTHELTMMTEK
jgi:hypothetical protein